MIAGGLHNSTEAYWQDKHSFRELAKQFRDLDRDRAALRTLVLKGVFEPSRKALILLVRRSQILGVSNLMKKTTERESAGDFWVSCFSIFRVCRLNYVLA